MRKQAKADRAYRVVRGIENDTYAMLRSTLTQPWRYARKVIQLDEDLVGAGEFDDAIRSMLGPQEWSTVVALQSQAAATFGEDLVQLARWQRHKIIYSIHPETLQALMGTDWEKTPIPGEILTRLPHPDVMVVLPEPIQWRNDEGNYETYEAFGVFGVRDKRRRTSSADPEVTHIALHFFGRVTDADGHPIVLDFPDFTSPGSVRRVPQVLGCRSVVDVRVDATLPEREKGAIADMFAGGPGALAGFASMTDAIEGMALLTRTGLAILTYIASENLDISRGPQEPQGRRRRGSGADEGSTEPASLFRVGYTIGGALQAANGDKASTTSGSTGRSVSPHVRRAHLHTFRRGPGHSERFVKWLPPIAVKADTRRKSTTPVVHLVE